ncbi:amino acid permease/ SLC12A domain-containing protein [Phycomyces blakesleeanus]|uniref:Amino acid permease/ SLC12A domain-containing protein n=1 Tax=Phycomyces blakesleeanus TaxID=4837 RepID=A0ABR3BEH7_PHYBL
MPPTGKNNVETISISNQSKVEADTMIHDKGDAVSSASLESQAHGEGGLKRSLKSRHLTMISLGGVIGQGLFLSSGGNLAAAGPAGSLIAYAIIGFIVFWVTFSLGEMATYIPVSGSFTIFCRRFVDDSFGATIGWNYWACWAIIVASELTALPLVMNFWTEKVPSWAWSGIWLIVIFVLNLFGARSYGEAEYWFSVIKILAVLIFIIVGCFTSGGVIGDEVYGFKYWVSPGAFTNGALGVVNAFVLASFSMQGTEIVGITAGECGNPRKEVPRAIRNVFWRIIIFYLGSVFVMGMIVPSNDPRNLDSSSGTATVSPFTIVFQKSGISGITHIMNAVILITVLSCANSGMYVASRTLCALSQEGLAPRKLAHITNRGVPIYALLCTAFISLITFATSFIPGKALFIVLTKLSGVAGFVTWGGISFAHYRFRKAYISQGRKLSDLPFVAPCYPFGDIFGMIACIVIALMAGYSYFSPASAVGLIGNYAGLILCAAGFITTKLWTKSKMVPIDQIDLDTGRMDMDYSSFEDEPEVTGPWYKRWGAKLIAIIT